VSEGSVSKDVKLIVPMDEKSPLICHAERNEASGSRTWERDSSLRCASFRMTKSRNILMRRRFYVDEPLF
jgi:hypothetical protein